MSLRDVVEHLVLYGPARNEEERDQLLALLDDSGKAKPSDRSSKEGKS